MMKMVDNDRVIAFSMSNTQQAPSAQPAAFANAIESARAGAGD
jgi:hypothetical protein